MCSSKKLSMMPAVREVGGNFEEEGHSTNPK